MSGLLLPVGERTMSSWATHQRRVPPSSEPGTDFYCPIGTPVLAPANGVIYGYGTSVIPATGRWVGLHLENGMAWRAMHFSRLAKTSGFVRRGEVVGYTGASGYGSEFFGASRVDDPEMIRRTGGPHTHVTLWPTYDKRFGYNKLTGKPYTVDFMQYADTSGSAAGGGSTPIPTILQGGKMVIYAQRDDGLIVAIPEGASKTYNFKSVAEYNRLRATIDVVNGQRQATGDALLTRPPRLDGPAGVDKIVKMSAEKLNDLIHAQQGG